VKWITTAALLLILAAAPAQAQPVKPKHGGTGCNNPTTVAGLASYTENGTECIVTDGVDASDCSTGSGSTVTKCCRVSGSWTACGGGGGGDGDITAVGGCITGNCFTDGGTGSSFTIEGSSVDEFETVVSWTEPAADRAILFADESGTVCTTAGSAGCTAVYSAAAHSHSADVTAIGDCASGSCFSSTDTASNTLYFEGPSADVSETTLYAAAGIGDFSVAIPAETGTICTDVSTLSGCGKVNGPATSTNLAIPSFSGTDGKNLRNGQCTLADTDGDANGLGDQITCPGGFVASDRNGFATPAANYLLALDNDTAMTPDPTCANACAAGQLCILDIDESSSDDWEVCVGTSGVGDINLFRTAGRSLTLTTNDVAADAELYTDSGCINTKNPASSDQHHTVWRAPVALTITEIYCEVTDGTSAGADLNIDDGSPAGVNGSDITCTTSGVTDATLAGDTTMAAGDRLDLDVGTVTGVVTELAVCMKWTVDD
jgi:hypothetical protein